MAPSDGAPRALPGLRETAGGRGEEVCLPQTLFLTLVESVVSTSHSSPQRGYPEARAAPKLAPFFRFHEGMTAGRQLGFWRRQWGWAGSSERSRANFFMDSLYSGNFPVLGISSIGRWREQAWHCRSPGLQHTSSGTVSAPREAGTELLAQRAGEGVQSWTLYHHPSSTHRAWMGCSYSLASPRSYDALKRKQKSRLFIK